MNPGNPTEKIIPPVTRTVKAGSLVFKQGETAHEMCLVEEGELVAVTGDGLHEKELFRLGKGSLVGVAAVLDNEPNKHDIKAVVDSRLTIIGGAAIASLLKTAPIWFLAALKTLTSRTRLLREGFSKPLFTDCLQSFARFLSLRYKGTPLSQKELLREYCWQTRASEDDARAVLRTLVRRNMIKIFTEKGEDNPGIVIDQPELLVLLTEYISCTGSDKKFPPFELSQRECSFLEFLSLEEHQFTRDMNGWAQYLQVADPSASQEDVSRLYKMGIFRHDKEGNGLRLQGTALRHFLLAIHNETSISGLCI